MIDLKARSQHRGYSMSSRHLCAQCGRSSPIDPGVVIVVVTVSAVVVFALLLTLGLFVAATS